MIGVFGCISTLAARKEKKTRADMPTKTDRRNYRDTDVGQPTI